MRYRSAVDGQQGDDDKHQQAFAAGATAADQLPIAGHDRESRPAPSRFTYPTPQQGGRLADG